MGLVVLIFARENKDYNVDLAEVVALLTMIIIEMIVLA